jgi:hypothetical protein
MMGNARPAGSQKTLRTVPAGYRERRSKKTKKRKKEMIIENVEENRKKTISYSFKPPIWLQFRIGADTGVDRAA